MTGDFHLFSFGLGVGFSIWFLLAIYSTVKLIRFLVRNTILTTKSAPTISEERKNKPTKIVANAQKKMRKIRVRHTARELRRVGTLDTLSDIREVRGAYSESSGGLEGNYPERANFCVFSPKEFVIGQSFLVQVGLFLTKDSRVVHDRIHQADPESEPRSSGQFDKPEIGHKIAVRFVSQTANVDEEVQFVDWSDEPQIVAFDVEPLQEIKNSFSCKVEFFVEGVLVAVAKWRMVPKTRAVTIALQPASFVSVEQKSRIPFAIEVENVAPRKAFVSYASEDRMEVVRRIQVLKSYGIRVLMDILELEPGERWEQKLYELVRTADDFLLFWSKSSAVSTWVEKEWRLAVTYRDLSALDRPNIRIVILHKDPPVPPAELNELHFNDSLALIIDSLER